MAVCSNSTVETEYGLVHCAKHLLEVGEPVHARQRQRMTARMLAAKYGRRRLVSMLVKHGAGIDFVDSQVSGCLFGPN